jgi:hypothetical protein
VPGRRRRHRPRTVEEARRAPSAPPR